MRERFCVFHELYGAGYPVRGRLVAGTVDTFMSTVEFLTAGEIEVPQDSLTPVRRTGTDNPRDYLNCFVIHEKFGLGRVFDVDAKRMLVVDFRRHGVKRCAHWFVKVLAGRNWPARAGQQSS